MRLLCLLLTLAAVVHAGDAPSLRTRGSFEIATDQIGPQARMSADGRWLVTAHGARKDEARGGWSFAGFTLVDLKSAAVAAVAGRTRLGRNSPVFSRDGRWLAWCDGSRRDRLTVHRRELANGRVTVVPIALPSDGFPTLCAIGVEGRRAVLARPVRGHREAELVVVDLETRAVTRRIPHFKEPYFSSIDYHVTLHGDTLLHHTRPPDKVSGAGYRLVHTDLRTGKEAGRWGAYVARATPRYRLTRDGATLINGTGAFEIQEHDLRTGVTRTLFDARERLYSHFLEVTLSPDERTLVAWSGARKTLLVWDREQQSRSEIELPDGGHLLGVTADGEHFVMHVLQRRVELVDRRGAKRTARLAEGRWRFARLDPTGRTLVLGRPKKGSSRWTIRVDSLTR